jgi:anti-anti-sigma regulatory factor
MFRITVHRAPGAVTFQFEGRLAGDCASEARAFWRKTTASEQMSAVRFDLTGVTSIDAAGRAFLSAAHARGTELVASGCLLRAIVAELAETPVAGGGRL